MGIPHMVVELMRRACTTSTLAAARRAPPFPIALHLYPLILKALLCYISSAQLKLSCINYVVHSLTITSRYFASHHIFHLILYYCMETLLIYEMV